MFDNLKTGITLTNQSYRILLKNKYLLIFPIIAFVLNAALFAAIMIPIAKVEMIAWKTHQTTINDYILCFGILMLFFFIAHLISMLMHGALTVCSIKQLRGESYPISSGFKAVFSHFTELFVWNLFMTTAGILIRLLEQFVEHWFTYKKVNEWLAGLTWLIAAIFVLPVLMAENTTTLPAIKRSAHLVKNMWGGNENLTTIGNMGIIIFFLTIFSFLPALVALMIHGKIIILIGSMVTMILFACNTIFFSATRTILISALYLFAKNESVSSCYDDTLMRKMFQSVKR